MREKIKDLVLKMPELPSVISRNLDNMTDDFMETFSNTREDQVALMFLAYIGATLNTMNPSSNFNKNHKR